MRIVLAAIVIVSLVAPALAQQEHVRGYREQEPDKSPAQKAADKAAAEAYKRSLGSIPALPIPGVEFAAMRGRNLPQPGP
jgi:TRAP-type C4-dicarboxylate transport system substrate-binding protein